MISNMKAFLEWAQQIRVQHLRDGVKTRITENATSDNLSARLDIDTPTSVARITFWESGDYDAEIIDVDSERTVFLRQGRLINDGRLSAQFAEFFQVLGIAPE